MTLSINIDLGQQALRFLGMTPEEAEADGRFRVVAGWYHEGRLGAAQAAAALGMTRLAFLDELGRRGMDVLVYGVDGVDDELCAFDKSG